MMSLCSSTNRCLLVKATVPARLFSSFALRSTRAFSGISRNTVSYISSNKKKKGRNVGRDWTYRPAAAWLCAAAAAAALGWCNPTFLIPLFFAPQLSGTEWGGAVAVDLVTNWRWMMIETNRWTQQHTRLSPRYIASSSWDRDPGRKRKKNRNKK